MLPAFVMQVRWIPAVLVFTDFPGVCGLVLLKAAWGVLPPRAVAGRLPLPAARLLAGPWVLAGPAGSFSCGASRLMSSLALAQSLIGWLGNFSFVASLRVARLAAAW